MKKIISLLVLMVFGILLGCLHTSHSEQLNLETTQPMAIEKTDVQMDQLFRKSYQTLFAARPIDASLYAMDAAHLGGSYQDRLDDYSPAAEARLRAHIRRSSFMLEQAAAQSVDKQEHKAVVMDLNRYFAGDENFDIGYVDTWLGLAPFIVNQISGPLIYAPDVMLSNQPLDTVDQVHDYLKRLQQFDAFVKGVEDKLLADAAQGWIPPKVIVEKSIRALQAFVEPAEEDHPLIQKLHQQLPLIKDLSEADRQALIFSADLCMRARVYPAYRRIIKQLETLLPSAPLEAGIWAQPKGAAFYLQKVKKLGDTDLTAEQVHQFGLAEVKRILQAMDEILITQGLLEGSVAQRLQQLQQDPQFFYDNNDAGRKQLLHDLNQYIEQMQAQSSALFLHMPEAPVEVRRFPESREAFAASAMYTPPALDGSAPGIYWINLKDMKVHPKYALKTLTYHEAFPGHHLQMGLSQELTGLPLLRLVAPYNAYVEGWALYTEKLAHEMGMYADDPYADLGRLQAELFRSARLVVDTGLHYKKWTREQAIQYMVDVTGKSETEMTSEVERYMVWPGQALGYKLGMKAIMDMREYAQQNLSHAFNLPQFHDVILQSGAVPMHLLQQKVRAWVRDVQKTAAFQKSMGLHYWQNLVCLETHCFLMKR